MFSALSRFGRLGAPAGRSLEAAIRALFAGGQQGAWYDPSDLTTLYQDSAGTTPVTAVEQPVGLMLDKSQGLVLGPELVSNGDFSNGLAGWSNTSTGSGTVSVVDGQAVVTGVDTSNRGRILSNSFSTVVGRAYRLSWTVVSGSVNSQITVSGGTTVYDKFGATTTGTFTALFFAAATTTVFSFNVYGNGTVVVDNFSVRELPGYHAYHTPGDTTTRPTLSRRINLLTKTESLSDAAWEKGASPNISVTDATTEVLAPDGTYTASKLNSPNTSGPAFLRQLFTVSLSQYSGSLWVRKGNYRYFGLRVVNNDLANDYVVLDFDANGGAGGIAFVPATENVSYSFVKEGDWFRFTVVNLPNGTSRYFQIGISDNLGSESPTVPANSYVYAWHPSLVPADLASLPYQRVNTTTDYDSDASKFPTFLRCDGTNDGMQTNAIDFTGTDKMFVGAAVRKLSDAAVGSVVGLSATPNTSAGTFEIYTPNANGGALHWFFSRGTSTASTSASYPAPITSVISGIGDISGDSAIMRVNGAQAAASAVDQGTGNYGNYKLYLFMRGGSGYPFNGWFYGGLIKGATLSASQIALAERWLAEKTKTVTLA